MPAETCALVLKSLEKVLQNELTAKGGSGILNKIAAILHFLGAEKRTEA